MKSFFLMLLAMILISVLSIPAIVLNMTRKLLHKDSISEYFKTIAIGFDQVGGSILYEQEDWTVSSWTYYLSRCGNTYALYFRKFIDLIFGVDHCKNSFFKEAEQLKFDTGWLK